MIPIPPQLLTPLAKAIGIAALAVALYGLGQWHGREAIQEKWDVAVAAQAMEAAEHVIKAAQNTAAIESKYQQTIDAQAKRVRQLTKEVKFYANSPAKKCVLSPEFVTVFDALSRLHDAPADGVPAAADSSGAVALVPEAPITDAEVLAVHQLTTAELAQLWDAYAALRDWVRTSHAIASQGAGR